MTEVRIISTCLVQGSAMAAEMFSSKRIELTPWDLQLLLLDTIQQGLLFPKPTSQQLEVNLLGSNVIDHLKISLSKTLDQYPPLAGRLGSQKNNDNTDSLFVECSNLGAQFTHAIVDNLTMADILEPTYVPSIVRSFFSLNGVRNWESIFKPLLAIQVTELVDGFFIGCTMNHSVVDGTSFWNFINSWSQISRGSEVVSNSPVFGPWYPDDFSYPIRIYSWDDLILERPIINPLLTEKVFHFTKGGIAKLKAKANSEVGTQNISSLQALLAHLWRTIARYRHLDAEEEIHLLLVIGVRDRLKPPLPKGYFGNAIYLVAVTSTAANLRENGIGWAAMLIHKHVAMQTSEEVNKWYADWTKTAKLWKKREVVRRSVAVSSSPRFNTYGNDFGWGKPVAVRSGAGNKFDGMLTLFSGAEDGDIDIEVCLIPETLHALGKDAEFMEGISTIQESR